MLIKLLLFLVALTAHFWLWGQWSLETTVKTNLMLLVATILLLILIGMPIRSIVNKQNPKLIFAKYWMQALYYTYLVLIIVMGFFSFYGIMQILLPIKVLLLVAAIGLRFLLKKKKKEKPAQDIQ